MVISARAADDAATMDLDDGKMQLKAPAGWLRKKPQTSIVEYEFAVPAVQGDTNDGRMTVMAASGGLEANVDRWYGQFTQPDGSNTRDRAKVKQIKVENDDVHLVDISGTYDDKRGPMAPGVKRPKYRMLAAIIVNKAGGNNNYFVKLYGPERTIANQEKAFVSMIEGLTHK
jgi:hypothetical protein